MEEFERVMVFTGLTDAGSFQAEISLELEKRDLISSAKGSELMVMVMVMVKVKVMKNKLDRFDLQQLLPVGAISSCRLISLI